MANPTRTSGSIATGCSCRCFAPDSCGLRQTSWACYSLALFCLPATAKTGHAPAIGAAARHRRAQVTTGELAPPRTKPP
eukprot:5870073-Pyramimonas_sp.AAC.1